MGIQTTLYQVANNAQSTLAEDLTNSETDIDVASGHGARFPSPGNGFYATIWDESTYADPGDDPNMEVVFVSARSTDTLTVTRGQRGTSGVTHSTGDTIALLIDSTAVSNLNTAVNALEYPVQNGMLFAEFLGDETPFVKLTAAGGTLSLGATYCDSGHPGVVALNVTNSGDAISVGGSTAADTILLGGGEQIVEALVYLPDLATVGDDYTLRIGFMDARTTTAITNGAYLEYSRADSVNWRYVTKDNSTTTATASGTAVAEDSWLKLRVVVNAAATSVEFFVNGTSLGTTSTNIPTAAGREVAPLITLHKTAGTNGRDCRIDYLLYRYNLTASR